jgi:hypothetical protein
VNCTSRNFTVHFHVWVYDYFWVSERWWFCHQNVDEDQYRAVLLSALATKLEFCSGYSNRNGFLYAGV